MFLGTLRYHERVFVQAAAATSVSSPMEDERRTYSARPRIASARAAAAAFARSSTNLVEAPSSTKLLRRSIMAGAPVERGVSGSELETESMASTNSAPEWPEFEACALPAGCGTLVELTGYGLVLSAVNRSAAFMRRKTLRCTVSSSCNLV